MMPAKYVVKCEETHSYFVKLFWGGRFNRLIQGPNVMRSSRIQEPEFQIWMQYYSTNTVNRG